MNNKLSNFLSSAPGKQTLGYYVAFTSLGLANASLGPTLPKIANHTHTLLSQVSFLIVARSLGYMLGAVLGGQLFDRYKGMPVMVAALVSVVVCMVAIPTIPLLWILMCVLFLLGVVEGVIDVGGNTMLIWVHGPKSSPFMNGLHFFWGIGALISPLVVGQVILRTGDIHGAYWGLAVLILIVALNLIRLPSPAIQGNNKDEAGGEFNIRLIVFIALFYFLCVGAEASIGDWIYSYMLKSNLGTEVTASFLNSAFWGSITLGRLFAIPISTRVKPPVMLTADVLGCLAGILIIFLYPASSVAAWAGTLLFGISMASVFPMTMVFAGERMQITGKVNGWFFVGSSLGAMALPWLVGQLFETLGHRATMTAILIDTFFAVVIFFVILALYKEKKTVTK